MLLFVALIRGKGTVCLSVVINIHFASSSSVVVVHYASLCCLLRLGQYDLYRTVPWDSSESCVVFFLCCVVLCCVVLCCVVLCCVVLCCVVLCCVVLCCVALCCVVLCCVLLSCILLSCVVWCGVMWCVVVLCFLVAWCVAPGCCVYSFTLLGLTSDISHYIVWVFFVVCFQLSSGVREICLTTRRVMSILSLRLFSDANILKFPDPGPQRQAHMHMHVGIHMPAQQ